MAYPKRNHCRKVSNGPNLDILDAYYEADRARSDNRHPYHVYIRFS
jgi:hypothetical protein